VRGVPVLRITTSVAAYAPYKNCGVTYWDL
jgi:hypothetical protein